MTILMRHVSMVVLLSTALASGQAVAKPPSKLSGKLQSFRAQVRKVMESRYTPHLAIITAGLGAGGFEIARMLDTTQGFVAFPFTMASLWVLSQSLEANLNRRHYDEEGSPLRALARKVLESRYTPPLALISAGLGATGLLIASPLDPALIAYPFLAANFVVLGHSIDANVKRLDAADAGEVVQ